LHYWQENEKTPGAGCFRKSITGNIKLCIEMVAGNPKYFSGGTRSQRRIQGERFVREKVVSFQCPFMRFCREMSERRQHGVSADGQKEKEQNS